MLDNLFSGENSLESKKVGLSEVIYSRNFLDEDMYELLGYITEPDYGRKLTDKYIMSLNNKEFIYLTANLFNKFNKVNIDLDNISVDENFRVYINVVDKIISPNNTNPNKKYVYNLLDKLEESGYNVEKFTLGIELSKKSTRLIEIADSMKSYCPTHNMYYDGNKYSMCSLCAKTLFDVSRYNNTYGKFIYEDEYAFHYNLDDKYNLKIYKTNNEQMDLNKIEKIIDSMVTLNYENKKIAYSQDLFLPVKKAIKCNSSNKFVGYIYNRVDFIDNNELDDICINLCDTENLMNLARIKACIRLIQQFKELNDKFSLRYCNPIKSVFICKSHKKQVQFANPEFWTNDLKEENKSQRYIIDYIKDVLCKDKTININIEDNITLFRLKEKLEEYSKKLTKYCSYHNWYFSSDYICCPKCYSIEEQYEIKRKSVNVSNREVSKWTPINEGGESLIYSYPNGKLAKIFKNDEINYNFKVSVLTRILKKKEIFESINKSQDDFEYIVPEQLLIDKKENNIIGYIMKKVDGSAIFNLRNKNEVEKNNFERKDILEILIKTGNGIEELHQKANIFVGDLNGRNILFDKNKKIYFIDLDGMGVDNLSPEFFTDGYVDPVSKRNKSINMKDDWYSFAIQAFYYLTYTHPFNGIYVISKKGKRQTLDIIQKMEKRISLLGDHEMIPPKVALDWEWMSPKLVEAFLNIFEGDSRVSIVPLLEKYYNEQYLPKRKNISR